MINQQNPATVGAQPSPLGEWLTPGRFACLLGLLIFAAFPQVVLGLHSFAYRDFGLFGYPLAHYVRDSFWRGEIPLWNPYNDLGTPFLAQWGTMVLYPPSLIYVFLPLPWSLCLFCLLHLFFGGMGMYVLASKWTGNRLAGGVAGIGFAFSGVVLNALMWPNYTASLAWMPWVTYAVVQAWQVGGRRVVWAAIAGALQMLSGTPEVILFTWLIIAALWLCTALNSREEAWISGRRALAIVVLVTMLAAAQLLPFLELLSRSQRGADFEQGMWPVPIWGWANLFVPMFRVYPTGCGVHFQYGQMFTSSIYCGIFVMLLAVLGALWCRDRRMWVFLAVALGSLVLSMGEAVGVYPMLRKLFPPLGFMRYTSKFTILMAFAWPVVAAFGLAALLRPAEGEPVRRHFRTFAAVAGLLALVAGSIVAFAWFSPPFPREDVSKTFFNGLTRVGLMLAAGAGLVLLVRFRGSQREWIFYTLVLFLVWMDYMSHMPQQNPTLAREALTIKIPQIEEMTPRPKLGESRAVLSIHARQVFSRAPTANLTQTYLCLRNGLLANANLVERIPKVDGFYALSIKDAYDVEARLFQTETDLRPALARFVGVSQLTSATNLMRWDARPDYMPLVTAGQLPVFLDPGKTLSAVTNSAFAPEQVVFLPESARPRVTVSKARAARVVSSRFREHTIEAEVQAAEPSMVVIAQAWYPGWRAYVDDQPVELWQANYCFQALQVGAGTHKVRLVYADSRFRIGSAVSLLGVGLCVGSVLLSRRQSRAGTR